MDQSEFSVAGVTGNSSTSVTAKSAVPFSQSLVFFSLLAVHSRLAHSRDYLERDSKQSRSAQKEALPT